MSEQELPGGARLRRTEPTAATPSPTIVVGFGGGVGRPATPAVRWNGSIEWLFRQLRRDLPAVAFAELRYRNRSWRAFGDCVHDAREALAALPGDAGLVLVGFSMGGGVAVAVAGDPRVRAVVGLAPWVPEGVPLEPLAGKRLAIVHGTRDPLVPGFPGVPAAVSERTARRAAAIGVDASHLLLPGALHGIALRTPVGLVPLPGAGRWRAAVAAELGRVTAMAYDTGSG